MKFSISRYLYIMVSMIAIFRTTSQKNRVRMSFSRTLLWPLGATRNYLVRLREGDYYG